MFEARAFKVGGRLDGIMVGAAERFGNDLVNNAEFAQIFRRDLERFGGQRGLDGVAPEDGSATFRGNNRIISVLQNTDPVRDPYPQGAAATSFTDDRGNDRRP